MKITSIKNSTTILFFLSLLLISLSCNKSDDDDGMTDPTFPYFQMEVDGELWAPSGASFGGGAPFDVTYRPDSNGLINLSAININKNISHINLASKNIIPNIKLMMNRKIFFEDNQFVNGCQQFTLDSLKDNYLLIQELDEDNRKIKVLFEFDCFNECDDIHKIRNGIVYANYGS